MNSTVQRMNSLVALPTNSVKNLGKMNNASAANAGGKGWNTPLLWFGLFLIVALVLFGFYYRNFMNAMNNITDQINLWLTGTGAPAEEKQEDIPVAPPTPPQDEATKENTGMSGIVEKILPPAKEVFTISKNNYSYYDAAPLCKALGAELATYDQVKDAWQKGADWCNYGWVKGQSAVYPIQEETWKKLQSGPDEEKNSCGVAGLNGGFFDNPEMKFGVNCFGVKPGQSEHDEEMLMKQGMIPRSVPALEVDKKVQEFKKEADHLGIMPFNENKWSS
jgi:hypothetical protein